MAKEKRDKADAEKAGDAQKLYNKGDAAYNRGDYKEAFKCFSKAAKLGHEAAQNFKIYMLREGLP